MGRQPDTALTTIDANRSKLKQIRYRNMNRDASCELNRNGWRATNCYIVVLFPALTISNV